MMVLTPVVRIAAVLSLVGALLVMAAAMILRQSVNQLRADRALVEHREDLARQSERLFKDLAETETERAALRRIRPAPEQLIHFVEGLEAAAARAFIEQTIAAVPPKSDTSGQPYDLPVVRYRITLQGTADKVETYLRELTQLPELVRIEHVELKAPPDGHVFTNATAEAFLAVAVQEAK